MPSLSLHKWYDKTDKNQRIGEWLRTQNGRMIIGSC